jgi:hypothetical protein
VTVGVKVRVKVGV